MNEYINGNLVRRILVYPKKKNSWWKHKKGIIKFLWITKEYDYWEDYFEGTLNSEEFKKYIENNDCYVEDDNVYYYPHAVLEFSSNHNRTIYFNTIEGLYKWVEDFTQQYPKTFIRIK